MCVVCVVLVWFLVHGRPRNLVRTGEGGREGGGLLASRRKLFAKGRDVCEQLRHRGLHARHQPGHLLVERLDDEDDEALLAFVDAGALAALVHRHLHASLFLEVADVEELVHHDLDPLVKAAAPKPPSPKTTTYGYPGYEARTARFSFHPPPKRGGSSSI